MTTEDPTSEELLRQDPLLVHFTHQFCLRARFYEALEEIRATSIEDGDPEDILEAIKAIVAVTLDPSEVKRWLSEGAPVPYVREGVSRNSAVVLGAIEQMIEESTS